MAVERKADQLGLGEKPKARVRDVHVVNVDNSRDGERFFSPLHGNPLRSLSLSRYGDFDTITFGLGDNSTVTLVGVKEGFVAVEMHDAEKGQSNLTFREDTRHKGLNMAMSVIVDQEVHTILDDVAGEKVEIDPTVPFAEVAFDDALPVNGITPSWYTEDWVTINLGEKHQRRIVIRADRGAMLGSITTTEETGTDVMNIGINEVFAVLENHPIGRIPATFSH